MWRPRRPVLTAAQQYAILNASGICTGNGTIKPGRLSWRFEASPSPLSRRYSVRIDYRQGATPLVFVDRPDLVELSGGRRLPHVYAQKPPRLCLYFPSSGEWAAEMRIDQTIVPWTILWLFYFEEWLDSNEWKGGGVHPKESD
jgi:hypothetical protein